MSQPTQQQRPQRRWYQFSIRTLLILVACAAGLAFAWAKCVEPYRLQRETMGLITKLGGTYKSEDATGWVRYLDRNPQDIVVVDLADCDAPDEYMPHLARLPKLRTLIIGGHQVGDEQVAALGRVGSLRGLVLDSTKVSDECVETLKETLPDLVVWKSERRAVAELEKVAVLGDGFEDDLNVRPPHAAPILPVWLREDLGARYVHEPVVGVILDKQQVTDDDLRWLINLKDVRVMVLGQTEITDDVMVVVGALNELEYLDLFNTRTTDAGLRHIAKLPHLTSFVAPNAMGDEGLAIVAGLPMLKTLNLSGARITEDGLHYLAQCKTLRHLWCDGSRLSDKGASQLETFAGLTSLSISRTGISPAGIQRLKKALPKCDIYCD